MYRIRRWSWLMIAVTVFSLLLMAGCSNVGKMGQPDNKAPAAAAAGVPLTVKVLDVGQGDAILIRTPDQVVLVDTGDVPAREKLVGMLKSQGISTIDKLIITHPHADHMGGRLPYLTILPLNKSMTAVKKRLPICISSI
jgi:competence protein ComEC